MEKVRPWCGQPSDGGRLRNRTEQNRTVDSRVGMFPEVFGMADGRSESTEGRSKPRVGWRLTSGEFGDDRCMFIE